MTKTSSTEIFCSLSEFIIRANIIRRAIKKTKIPYNSKATKTIPKGKINLNTYDSCSQMSIISITEARSPGTKQNRVCSI
jgi:hypothetical protein